MPIANEEYEASAVRSIHTGHWGELRRPITYSDPGDIMD